MKPNDVLVHDKPFTIYLHWTCGDGCCGNSQTVTVQPGTYSVADLIKILDERDYCVYTEGHHDDWLVQGWNGDDYEYYNPEEDERE